MGHIQKRGVRRYRARYTGPDGREKSKTFTRRVDADRFLKSVEADVLRGTFVDPTDRTTVTEYAKRWAAQRPHRPTTARRVASLISNHIEGTPLGESRLASVLPSDVQAWVTSRSEVLSASTLRTLTSLLRSIFHAAALDRLIPASPVVRIVLPPLARKRLVPLTVAQVKALAEAMPRRNRAMVITQAGLGLRIGELLALRIENVDFLHRTVEICEQIAPGGRHRTPPKTPRSRRQVPLPSVVSEALASHIREFPPGADGSIFTTRFGRPYSHTYYGTMIFKKAVKAAELPHTTSHHLRHHYVSVLLAGGESAIAVAERLGHEDATLVLKVYGHLMPDQEDRTRKVIEAAWRVMDGQEAASPDDPDGFQQVRGVEGV